MANRRGVGGWGEVMAHVGVNGRGKRMAPNHEYAAWNVTVVMVHRGEGGRGEHAGAAAKERRAKEQGGGAGG